MQSYPAALAVPCESMAQFLRSHMVTLDTSTLMGSESMMAELNCLPELLEKDSRCRLFLLTPVLDELEKHAANPLSPRVQAQAANGLMLVNRLAAAGMTIFDVPPLPHREGRRFFDAALIGVCQRYHSCAQIGVITQDNKLAASLLSQNAMLPSRDVVAVRRLNPATGCLSCFDRKKIDRALCCPA